MLTQFTEHRLCISLNLEQRQQLRDNRFRNFVLTQFLPHPVQPDFVQFIDGTIESTELFRRHAGELPDAGDEFPVIDINLELLETEARQHVIDKADILRVC